LAESTGKCGAVRFFDFVVNVSVAVCGAIAESEEKRKPLIDRGDLFSGKFSKNAMDPSLVD
jgi:hypothetical protein